MLRGILRLLEKNLIGFLYWRGNHISHKNFFIITSIIIGIVSSLAAVALKVFVHFLKQAPDLLYKYTDNHLWYIFLPSTGIS